MCEISENQSLHLTAYVSFFFHFKDGQPREIRSCATKGFVPHPRENFVDISFQSLSPNNVFETR